MYSFYFPCVVKLALVACQTDPFLGTNLVRTVIIASDSQPWHSVHSSSSHLRRSSSLLDSRSCHSTPLIRGQGPVCNPEGPSHLLRARQLRGQGPVCNPEGPTRMGALGHGCCYRHLRRCHTWHLCLILPRHCPGALRNGYRIPGGSPCVPGRGS